MGLHKREKNGLLSYENPNYHLDRSRFESAIYSELYSMHDDKSMDEYDAYLDNRRVEDEASSPVGKVNEKSGLITPPQNGGEDSPPPEKERADREASEKCHGSSGPVPHLAEGPNDDLYAIPVKLRPKKEVLPPGWEKHEDNDGPYYWHIKSGTIQREIPKMPPIEARESRISMVRDCSNLDMKYDGPMTTSVTRSTTSGALDHVDQEERKRKEEVAYKRRSYPARPDADGRAVRFFVRSLGWVEISESDLTPERSSRAVNKCIVDLSLGRNDLLDQVGRWGDGKDLFMDLDDGALKLIDPESLNTLHTQPIHTIRVWGVGRDNGRERDFAYVARDRATRKHMCHVFRCEAPARSIANALRDICKRIMIERSLQPPPRPTDLPAARRPRPLSGASFPTPMEEPRKTVRARYLGSAEVPRATGMDVLNDALERLAAARAPSAWRPVAVAVAPSCITITEEGESTPLVECRVRYLSFLGIGRDVRRCAFIVHTAQDAFVAHAFHADPSSGALCKTIEAACKLRYQKCLDAHGGLSGISGMSGMSGISGLSGLSGLSLGSAGGGAGSPGERASLGQALKSLVGSLTGRRPS
ncbi:protein Fe65 homolog isoform X1 [Colias croceus]|uniref:protein Fe65 homolog isoform X1 n=1 Tax=Colias crocea TaxID=72248 RepID=UPI001E27EC96|nr:protein Fe65 homolog isoform X1 [Colias croceus]XP_045505014.1 protein Fe65 homolog isoform X1 [Colias croceus]XP_045505015.1 protein Fe65 homolog isoform X1 [Colias croceus]XP_045505017.1 protein Fe65 homolog isoform X1 [Colias croceus]XP_045505018.1 protein Fe65 homolog isoform X1 [Colias croceus]